MRITLKHAFQIPKVIRKRRCRPSLRRAAYRPSLEGLETRALPSGTSAATRPQAAYGQIPLSFEINQGQAETPVQFLARGEGYGLFLTANEAVLTLSRPAQADAGAERMTDSASNSPAASADSTLRLHLIGANPDPQVAGVGRLTGVSNYLTGNDPRHWHTNVPTFAKVAYHDVYPGIDLVYYGNGQQLEYDFDLAPGADPNRIRLAFDGARDLTLDGQGNLVITMAGGVIVEHAPVLYQMDAGGRQAVEGHYVLTGRHEVRFAVGAYDAGRPLVIDPTLVYSTYLGGSGGDAGNRIVVDAAGNAYVTGQTSSTNFPTTAGVFQTTLRGSQNAFVTKLNASGSGVVYSTYLGGSGSDSGQGIALDAAGNAYVVGDTTSSDFPTTPGAFQTRKPTAGDAMNAFVTKLNAGGTALLYSTYLGGSGGVGELGTAVAVDSSGDAFVTGDTTSRNFPTTPGALQTTLRGSSNVYVTKFNANGTGLLYSTYLGGGMYDFGNGITINNAGNAFVTGSTSSGNFPITPGAYQSRLIDSSAAFVTKVNPSGTALVYSTYLGGSSGFLHYADAFGIAVDAAGNAFVSGSTNSVFPTTPGAFQTTAGAGYHAFVTKLNAAGSGPLYSTYVASTTGADHSVGLALDAAGNAVITGNTSGTDFPTTPDGFQTMKPSNAMNTSGFVTRLNAAGSALLYSTYLGGRAGDAGNGIALDATGNIYVTGSASSPDFPTTPGAFQTTLRGGSNAFVAKFGGGNAVTHYGVSAPATAQAGAAFGVTVTALDSANNVVPTYTGAVHFTSSDPQAMLPADYTFTAADQGVHTFMSTLKTVGSKTITATDQNSSSITGTATVVVTPAAVSALGVAGYPSPVNAGTLHTFSVTAQDAYGNTVTSYSGTITFTSSDPQATLEADYTFQPGDNGTHVFGAILKTAGPQSLTATDTGTGTITGTQDGILVNAAAVDHFGVATSADAGGTVAGSPFDVTVTALDVYGNTVTGYTGTVTFTSADPYGALLPADYTFTAADQGTVTFTGGATLYTAGSWDVTVTDTTTGRTGSDQVVVGPAAADHFRIDAPATVTAGQAFDVTVTALDPYGNIDSNYTGTVTFTTTDPDPGVILPPDYAFTAADGGVHTFAGGFTLITPGDQFIMGTDTVSGITGDAQATVIAGAGASSGSRTRSAGFRAADVRSAQDVTRPSASVGTRHRVSMPGWPPLEERPSGRMGDWTRDLVLAELNDDFSQTGRAVELIAPWSSW